MLKIPHTEIRAKLGIYLSRKDDYKKSYAITDTDILYLLQDNAWNSAAGDILPKVACDVYKVNIQIHKDGLNEPICFVADENNPECIKLRLKDDHYDIICEKPYDESDDESEEDKSDDESDVNSTTLDPIDQFMCRCVTEQESVCKCHEA